MFKHILVPLDGSHLAEIVLPVANYLGRVLGAQVTLVHIVEPAAAATVHGDQHLTSAPEAERYLEQIATQWFAPEVAVKCHVHTDTARKAARGILDHEDELVPDLVLMCSHGRSHLRSLLFGRIAQKIVAQGRTPVLVIPARATAMKTPFALHTILAPTDGQAEHEPGLAMAIELALATRAHMALVATVPTLETLTGTQATSGRLLPAATRTVLDLAQETLRKYLAEKAARAEHLGLKASVRLLRGDPASVIIDTAEDVDADLIVLATHGKAGARAFWAHSAAATVLAKTTRPILLVPLTHG